MCVCARAAHACMRVCVRVLRGLGSSLDSGRGLQGALRHPSLCYFYPLHFRGREEEGGEHSQAPSPPTLPFLSYLASVLPRKWHAQFQPTGRLHHESCCGLTPPGGTHNSHNSQPGTDNSP